MARMGLSEEEEEGTAADTVDADADDDDDSALASWLSCCAESSGLPIRRTGKAAVGRWLSI
jgi:hypothetical protein